VRDLIQSISITNETFVVLRAKRVSLNETFVGHLEKLKEDSRAICVDFYDRLKARVDAIGKTTIHLTLKFKYLLQNSFRRRSII
jgi:hypothetical protein